MGKQEICRKNHMAWLPTSEIFNLPITKRPYDLFLQEEGPGAGP